MVSVVLTGTRGCELQPCTGTAPLPPPRLHLAHRSRVKHETDTLLQTLLASVTEATKTTSLGLSKNPALALASTPGHPSRDVFRRAVSRTAKLLSDRLGDGRYYSNVLRRLRSHRELAAPFSPATP